MRLLVIDCLSDIGSCAEPSQISFEHLVEDLFDSRTSGERVGEALDCLLVDEHERVAARAALPCALEAYMNWDLARPTTAPWHQTSFPALQRAASALLACMRVNEWAHRDAVEERKKSERRSDDEGGAVET
jgi:hypothetical protein